MAAVKLLVKTARFTVSISTFSLCGSMEESVHFLRHQYWGAVVQFAPLQLPFILATVELSMFVLVQANAGGSGCPPQH